MIITEKLSVSKLCPTCHDEMVLEVASYPTGSAFLKNRFHVDIYRCPKCDRVKLFAAKSNSTTCPVCGATHPADERCVICALNTAFGGNHGNNLNTANVKEEQREKKSVPTGGTGVDQVEAGFIAAPAIDPVEEIEAESYSVSPRELEKELEEAGLK